ncbi:MAG: hypothetical protein J6L83_06905 [Clostridia bacterium]|nr:hypothetical protein [Clostridia bacterium]
MKRRTRESELLRKIRVAVVGELPTACDYLSKQGIISIDRYSDAVNITNESDYHLILIYAPQGEGIFNTAINPPNGSSPIPLRLLNEPCCHSALLELGMKIRTIARAIGEAEESTENYLIKDKKEITQ